MYIYICLDFLEFTLTLNKMTGFITMESSSFHASRSCPPPNFDLPPATYIYKNLIPEPLKKIS